MGRVARVVCLVATPFALALGACTDAAPGTCESSADCTSPETCVDGSCTAPAGAGGFGGGDGSIEGSSGASGVTGGAGTSAGGGSAGMKDSGPRDSAAASTIGSECKKDGDCGKDFECLAESGDDFSGGGPAGGYCTAPCEDDPGKCVALGAVCGDVDATGSKKRWCIRTCSLGPEDATKLDRDKCSGRGNLGCAPMPASGTVRTGCLPTCSDDDDCAASHRECDASLGVCVDSRRAGDALGWTCEPGAAGGAGGSSGSGSAGSSGSSGASGASGSSGASGASGSSGASGAPGTSGSAGTSGAGGATDAGAGAGGVDSGPEPEPEAAPPDVATPEPTSPCAGVCVDIGGSVGHPATSVCSTPCVIGDDPECPTGWTCSLRRVGSGAGDQGFCAELCDTAAECTAGGVPGTCDLAAKPRVGRGVCVYGGDGGASTDARAG